MANLVITFFTVPVEKTDKHLMIRAFFFFLAITIGICAGGLCLPLVGVHRSAQAAESSPSTEKLAEEISARISRVPEFQFIRQEAEKLGVKVYLFGGTAAAYSHYVRQDLAREAGDKRYPEMLYDYDYTNIFRSTQDLDIVVDGSADNAAALEVALKNKFPHFIGDKGANWEVRPLREARGAKEAILNNPDFSNQHTDSHSTGMVELTKPAPGEIAVKDVRDWNSKAPQFLKDVQSQKLHYYFNPKHASTSRAKQGLNPPILSVIRYLTKAFQYDLEIAPEDKKLISKIIQEFDPKSLKDGGYLERWVEKNGKKLFEHAVDIEHAWDTLEELGLRKKLISIQSNASKEGSLSWLLSKEPLRSKSVGQGSGKTAAEIAKELGQDKLIVAHETNSYLAYESITRSKAGDLNALISRKDFSGEMAAFGNGFYTQIGRKGARNTGITIRMELSPDAKEGADFLRHDNYIILKNRNAVRVITEQIKLSLPEYFQILAQGKEFSGDDKALVEAFKRRIFREGIHSEQELQEVYKIVKEAFSSEGDKAVIAKEWFALPVSKNYPELVEILLRNKAMEIWVIANLMKRPEWDYRPEWVKFLMESKNLDTHTALITNILHRPQWAQHQELLEKILYSGQVDHVFVASIFSKPHWSNHPEWVEYFLDKEIVSINKALSRGLSYPHWAHRTDWIERIIRFGKLDKDDLLRILSRDNPAQWAAHVRILDAALDTNLVNTAVAEGLSRYTNGVMFKDQPITKEHVKLMERLIEAGRDPDELAFMLGHEKWKDHPELVEKLINKGFADREIARHILTKEQWAGHPEWVETLIKRGNANAGMEFVLTHSFWQNNPRLSERCGGIVTFQRLRNAFLKEIVVQKCSSLYKRIFSN